MRSLLLESRAGGVMVLTLSRPERHNAFDEVMIDELTSTLDALAGEPSLRVLVLTGAGPSFSAGADLAWMARAAAFDDAANFADAQRLERLLAALDTFPRPTIARVNGPAIGGGLGLVAACDIAVAVEAAVFALSEVRLGLVPAVIAPYVLRAIGERAARRYFLSGERFTAAAALQLGLVHLVASATTLEQVVGRVVDDLLKGGPEAQAAAKALSRELRQATGIDAAALTARCIAERRASTEGREGVRAFLDKRPPDWRRRG